MTFELHKFTGSQCCQTGTEESTPVQHWVN